MRTRIVASLRRLLRADAGLRKSGRHCRIAVGVVYFMIWTGYIAQAWAVPVPGFEGAWIAHFDKEDSNLFANIMQMVNPFTGSEVFVFEDGHIFTYGSIIGPNKVFRIDRLSGDGRELDASLDSHTDYDGRTSYVGTGPTQTSIHLHAVLGPDQTSMTIVWKQGVEESHLHAKLTEGQRLALEQLHALQADLVARNQPVSCPAPDQEIDQKKLMGLQKELVDCKAKWTAAPVSPPEATRCPAVPSGRAIEIDGASVIGNSRFELHENPNQGRFVNIVGRTSLRGPNLRVKVNGQQAQTFGSCGDFSFALERSGELKQVDVEADSGDGKSAKLTINLVH